jgi:GTP-binding protein
MSRALQLKFVAAVPDVGQLPETSAEVAFLGRSNVGKSSLLNALAGQRLAQVSATPGRTQVLTCFQVERGRGTLVDCPGYGYAQAPKKLREGWLPMLEGYLLGRENLTKALLLLDGEIGPTDSDLHMLGWLRIDLAAACEVDIGDVFWVSAEADFGLSELRDQVRDWLA